MKKITWTYDVCSEDQARAGTVFSPDSRCPLIEPACTGVLFRIRREFPIEGAGIHARLHPVCQVIS